MASEVIALCQSFEQELSKILATLPPVSSSKPEVHDAHLNHHRISQRIAESVTYYAGRLPAYASVPRILSFGDKLLRLEQHQLALQACFKHVRSLSLHTTQENLPRLDALARVSSHVQACFGCAACEAALLLLADPQIKHPDTLQWLEQCLSQLRAAIALGLPDERLYWLVLNGSVHVYTTAKALITAGFSEQALPSLVFCIKAMEGHVCFAAPKFLPWRTQLYTWATYGLLDCKAYEQARALLADGLKRLDMLVSLQKLDPVPVSPAVKAAFSTTRSSLLGLQLRVEVAAGAPVAPLLTQLTGGTIAAPPPAAAAPATTAPAPPVPPSPEAQLTLRRSLVAVVEALHVPGRRIARCEPASGTLKELFDAALATAGPLMQALRTALAQAAMAAAAAAPAAGPAEAAGGGVLDGSRAGPDEAALAAVAAAAAGVQAAGEAFPFDVHKGLLCAAYNLELWPQFDELATLAMERSADLAGAGGTALNEHQQHQHLHPSSVGHAAGQLATVASLLLALRQLTTQPGVDALRQLASEIQQALTRGLPPAHPRGVSYNGTANGISPYNATNGTPNGAGTGTGAGLGATTGAGSTGGLTPRGGGAGHAVQQQWQLVPREQLRDLIADASLALYGSARPLIDGVFCAQDKEAGTVAELLAACHAAWSAVDLDDGQLRVGLALKLALLWEEDGQLAAAREVLMEAKSTVQRVRVELLSANRRAPDEHVRWITGSVNQPSDDTAARVAAMTPSEQELACLHVDVLALLARVELGLGVAEQQGRATARHGRLLVEQAQRAAQSRIFGERLPREVARDEARLAAASATPPNPQAKERELLQACGKNPYERALVLMQMSAFTGSDTARKMQLLQEAGDLLVKAQAAEDSLFAAAQLDSRTSSRDTPLQPRLLQRSPTSVTLVANPPGPGQRISSRARPQPTHYMAFCKAFGAGVGLSMNKTAMEYPGCGVRVPLGQPVTIQGLRTNDTYLFAVALYDDAGNLVGGLGTSTPEVLLALPLPLYMCWAHLLASAVRAGASAAAKRAAGVLLPHFVKTSPDVPLWAANPMDAQRLHRAHVAAAARPLLRAVVQSIYVYGGAALLRSATTTSPTAPAAPYPQAVFPSTFPQLRAPFLEEQVARLKAARLLVLGMEISALLPDEPLMQEGALRTYHLLAPLLALRAPRTHLLHKALAACHTVLSALSNLVQDSLHRQEAQRELSARVAAAVTYQLLRLSDASGEGAASAHFGRLQVEVLKAYDPRVSVSGRLPPPAELQDEAARLHEVVLQHPRLVEWGPESVVERQKEGVDLVARALPLIASAAPMDAWVQVLGFESATDHPRWVELVVRMLEAALRRGNPGNALAVAEELRWWVRNRSKVLPMGPAEEGTTSGAAGGQGASGAAVPPGTPGTAAPQPLAPKWSVEAAAAALAPTQVAFEAPPAPVTDGMSADEATAAKAQYAEDVRKVEEQQRRRVAAVLLLQQRLPRLLARKRAIERMRANIKRWSPWLARLNIMLGLTAAAEARAAALNNTPSALNPSPSALDGDRPSSPFAPPATGADAEAPLPAPSATGDGDGEANPDASSPPPDGMPPALRAMIHFARAAQLAARAGAWLEVGNAARHAWNLKQSVLNVDPSLTAPLPRVVWERGLLPEPPQPPAESLLVPATPPVPEKKGGKKGGKEGGKEEKKKEEKKPEKKAAKAGKKKGAVEEAPPAPPRTYPLPTGSRPNMARCTRAVTEALLALVSGLREGMVMHTWVLPRKWDEGKGGSGSGRGGPGDHERPGSAVVADSEFSYGSDLQVDIWFREGPLDLGWVSRFINGVAVVLSRGERWHSLLALGSSWAKMSEGAFNERLMPWLLMAAPKAGMDPTAFQAALDTLVRDKNQALDQLDKVRTLVRERLGETPLLSSGMGHKVRKKRKANVKRASLIGGPSAVSLDGRPGTSSTTITGDGGMSIVGGAVQSEGSTTVSYRTATTYRTRASQPDFLRIPTEYEKVIEMLKRRNEKAALPLALSELGDVHAHFGSWGPAATAWNDALDSLLGPYQAIRNWRPKLNTLPPAATLQAYGLHGLLLGSILTGKLARYTYHDHLTLRLEACRLGARLVFTAFSVHLGHPQRLLGFATYTPRELWAAGADGWTLWADAYRCPVSDLVGALETLTASLLDAGLALEALPVVALWEHLVRYVVRSLHGTVLCRVMRVRALAALGLLGEGMGVVAGLMAAAGLPDATLESDYVLKDASGAVVQLPPAQPFNNASLPGDPANKAALLYLADTPLPPAVERLYGSWLVAHLNLVRAQLLLLAGAVPNQWRATNWRTGEKVEMPKPVTPPAKGKGPAAGGKAAAGGAAAASAAAAVTAVATTGQEAVGIGLPEVLEPALLERANVLLRRAMAMARGEEQPSTDGSVAAAPAPSKGAGKGIPRASSPGKGRSKSPLSSARGGRPVTPTTPPSPSGPPVPGAPTAGQRAEVMVRTLLLLCELEQLRWQPARALGHALEAARFLGSEADRVNVPQQGDNDELERYSLSPVLWFLARAAAVRCAAQLGHGPHVRELVAAAATREASAVQEQLQTTGMEHMAALVLAAEGRTAEALTGLAAVAARYRALSVVDTRLAAVLLDEAALRDRLGLRREAAELAEQGLAVAEGWAMELGLGEALAAPELTNVYSDGTALYAHALGVAAVHVTRQRRHTQAERHAQAALRLLRQHTRGLPTQHAAAALTLGRMLRLAALCGGVEEESNGDGVAAGSTASVAATAAKLSAARTALSAAITLTCIDGGHLRGVIRSALLELASICIAGLDHRGAAACLRSAHAAAVQQDLVLLSGHSLAPVAVAQLPEWITTALRGQEAHFAATASGRKPDAAAAPALSDADVGRMTVCMLAGILRSMERQPVGGGFRARAEAKLAVLHSALKFACAKYGMDACFAEPPLPPASTDAATAAAAAAAAVLKEGAVIAQWHCQDGCWQESRSFIAEGKAPSGTVSAAPSDTQLLALPPVECYASLLYVVAPPGGAPPQCGEVTFPVAQVREVAVRVQQLRARMERPKAPTDILGYPPPSSAELTDLMWTVERLLTAAPRGSDDGTNSSLGGPLVSGLESSVSGAVVPSGKQVAGEVRPALELAFLRQLEALLSLDAGLDVSDGTLATWMLQTLPVQL